MSQKPQGRGTRGRDKLRANFIFALADDFAEHGKDAIVRMREEDPSGYVKCIASLMPKEMDISHTVNPLEHLSDEQLDQLVDATERYLAERAGENTEGSEGVKEQAEALQALH